jgi:hypothetical protein
VLSRLHFKWGWPKELLGTQSRKWEFDVTAYRASDPNNEYVACEVKKTVAELGQLVELMQRFSRDRDAGDTLKSSKEINAFRKLKGLQERHVSIFWAVGPNGASKVFRMTYTDGGAVIFKSASDDALTYADAWNCSWISAGHALKLGRFASFPVLAQGCQRGRCGKSAAIWGTPAAPPTHSGRQPMCQSGSTIIRMKIAIGILSSCSHAVQRRRAWVAAVEFPVAIASVAWVVIAARNVAHLPLPFLTQPILAVIAIAVVVAARAYRWRSADQAVSA